MMNVENCLNITTKQILKNINAKLIYSLYQIKVNPAVAEFEEWLIRVHPDFSISSQCFCKSFIQGLHFVTLYIKNTSLYII